MLVLGYITPKLSTILQGYPPKPVNTTNGLESLQALNFMSGDTLIVQEDKDAQNKQEEKSKQDEKSKNTVSSQRGNFMTSITIMSPISFLLLFFLRKIEIKTFC